MKVHITEPIQNLKPTRAKPVIIQFDTDIRVYFTDTDYLEIGRYRVGVRARPVIGHTSLQSMVHHGWKVIPGLVVHFGETE